MSDPLSIAASIAGIVSLSGAVFQQVSKFAKQAKGAEKNVKDLALQTRNLSGVLQNLALLASSLEHENATTTFKASHLHACHQTLLEVEKHLKKAQDDFDADSRTKTLMRSLKWPFSADETKSLIADMASHRATLELALSAETLEKLLQCLATQDDIKRGVESLAEKVDRISAIQTRVELDNKRKEIVEYFLRVNPQPNFQTSVRLRQPLTGLWLTESNPTFQKWRDIPNSALWLSGIPGAGKTVLCGVVTEEALQLSNNSTAVAFFFCDYKNGGSQQLVNILCSLAAQLAQQNDSAFELLEALFASLNPENGLKREPDADILKDLVLKIADIFERVFIILDGLDECGNNAGEVAADIRRIYESCPSASVAVFSRNEQDIYDELAETFTHIEIAAHTEDLDLYVRAEMSKRRQLKRLEYQSPGLAEEIREKLVNGAQGMFRWVACQLDYLCELTNNRARREALSSLPPTLQETYHRLLQRVLQAGPSVSELVRKTVHWVGAGTGKPFTVAELREGLSIPESHVDDFGDDDLIDADEIFRKCSSLVRKNQASLPPRWLKQDVVEFAHFTVEEYLKGIDPASDVGIFKLDHRVALAEVSTVFLRSVLTMGGDNDYSTLGSAMLLKHVTEKFNAHPFYYYSTGLLSGSFTSEDSHAGIWANIENSELFQDAECLFDPKKCDAFLGLAIGGSFNNSRVHPSAFDQHFWEHYDSRNLHTELAFDVVATVLSPSFTPLKFAAALGLPKLCMSLVERGLDVGHTTLQACLCCAIAGKHLISRTARGGIYWDDHALVSHEIYTGLRRRTIRHFLDCNAAHALKTGTQPEWPQDKGMTPLHYAVDCQDKSIVEAILQSRSITADDQKESSFEVLLDRAVFKEDIQITRLLLRYESHEFAEPFGVLACASKSKRALQEPEDHWVLGIPPSARLLEKAIHQGNEELCKRIISEGVSVDAHMPGCLRCPVRPVFDAIKKDEPSLVDFFILQGASVEDCLCEKLPLGLQSAVSLAIWYDMTVETLESILDACLTQRVLWMDTNLSPFHVAALKGNAEGLKMLHSHISINFKTYSQMYRHEAWCNSQSCQTFLSASMSTRACFSESMKLSWPLKEQFSGTPLHYAVAAKREQVTSFFIANGVNINALDDGQRTPLILAAEMGLSVTVEELLTAGANIYCYDEWEATVLMEAASQGNMDMISYLDEDASVLQMTDRLGQTVLHYATDSGDNATQVFSYFLAKGVDPQRASPILGSPVTYVFENAPRNAALTTYILNSGLLPSVGKTDPNNPLSCVATLSDKHRLLKRLLQLLRKHGMTENLLDKETERHFSPLCIAAIYDALPCLDQLLEFGADTDKEGCYQGSPLIAASTFGRLEAVKRLVRNGASISYTNEQGVYRNAFEAGRLHSHIREWFLVGRFQDQYKLATHPHWGGDQVQVRSWSGVVKAEWNLTGSNRRKGYESSFDYLCRVQRMKKDAQGHVVIPTGYVNS